MPKIGRADLYMLAGVVAAYVLYKGAGVVADVANAVNPLNNDNIINRGATGLYQGITGSEGTIGTDFYDATHGGVLSNGTFNPASGNNLINRGSAWAVQQIANDENATLGTKIYDWFH